MVVATPKAWAAATTLTLSGTVAVNEQPATAAGLTVTFKLYDMQGNNIPATSAGTSDKAVIPQAAQGTAVSGGSTKYWVAYSTLKFDVPNGTAVDTQYVLVADATTATTPAFTYAPQALITTINPSTNVNTSTDILTLDEAKAGTAVSAVVAPVLQLSGGDGNISFGNITPTDTTTEVITDQSKTETVGSTAGAADTNIHSNPLNVKSNDSDGYMLTAKASSDAGQLKGTQTQLVGSTPTDNAIAAAPNATGASDVLGVDTWGIRTDSETGDAGGTHAYVNAKSGYAGNWIGLAGSSTAIDPTDPTGAAGTTQTVIGHVDDSGSNTVNGDNYYVEYGLCVNAATPADTYSTVVTYTLTGQA
jgi:hypothetical protein